MRWKTTSEKSFIVLSNVGKLYYGEVDHPLKEVMTDIDAGMLILVLKLIL